MRTHPLSLQLITGLAFAVLWTAQPAAAQPYVQFELATERGFPLNGARQWLDLLKDFERTGVRIHAGRTGEEQRVENRGSAQSPSYHVVGILTSDNRLLLVGSRPLTSRDRTEMTAWIDRLRQDGVEGLTAERGAFGLTKAELVALHRQLARPVSFSTRGGRSARVASTLLADLPVAPQVTLTARRELAGEVAVADELKGLASGTALAALLRPLGLVAAPRKNQGAVQLVIAGGAELEEYWPVGWPPQQIPVQTAPALFEYQTVEISGVSLRRCLDAIQQRVEMPFLLDHNAIAELRVDLDAVRVTFPEGRTFYKRVLDRTLFQARLSSDLRVDEAGNAFLWITSR